MLKRCSPCHTKGQSANVLYAICINMSHFSAQLGLPGNSASMLVTTITTTITIQLQQRRSLFIDKKKKIFTKIQEPNFGPNKYLKKKIP